MITTTDDFMEKQKNIYLKACSLEFWLYIGPDKELYVLFFFCIKIYLVSTHSVGYPNICFGGEASRWLSF